MHCTLGHSGTVLLKRELARNLRFGRQQPLWQKQITVVGSIWIDEYQTNVANFDTPPLPLATD